MRWSQLRKLMEDLFAPELNLRVNCSAYRSEQGAPIGRYWFELDGKIIFDQPKNISEKIKEGTSDTTASEITATIREYLDTPKDEIYSRPFPQDKWGLIEILRAVDRRIGKKRLSYLYSKTESPVIRLIIDKRLGAKNI